MELYILDSLLRKTEVIDQFESLIWTERYSAYGDFQLTLFSTPEVRKLLVADTRLTMNESQRVMTINQVENKTDAEGRTTLKVSGVSLEAILEDRLARNTFANLTTTPKWIITGAPADIARAIFDAICRNNLLSVEDNIPFLQTGSISIPSTIPEPEDSIGVELDLMSVYEAIKQICDAYGLGFRLLRNHDTSELYFDVYSGNDRTTAQSTYPPVLFSQELDNLTDVTELTTTAGYKNVAYVYAPNGATIVNAEGAGSLLEGFARRVLYVKADDITLEAGEELDAALQQRGLSELSKYKSLTAFDGQIPQSTEYIYDVHYQLGDLVEIRNADGFSNQMRVAEQIFVSDGEGERKYPTLTADLFITPGSWLAWDYNQTWENADGTWAEA